MRLREALELINESAGYGESFPVTLACGFTPLHLATFLTAHLQLRRPGERIALSTGRYGDLLGTLNEVRATSPRAVFVVIEWADLDPRLGVRQLGGWSPGRLSEIVESAERRIALLEAALAGAAEACPVVCSMPLLDLPPAFYTVPAQLSPPAAALRADVVAFGARAVRGGIAVLDPASFSSEPRFDVRSALNSDFPYHREFASELAQRAASLILPSAPKKGLITDLDGTLWRGIVGEVGADNVRWDLDGKAQIHGIYQTLLQSLADAGVLLAVSSKNDPNNVAGALQRRDLLLASDRLFPIEVDWRPKSEAVSRILQAWNISADDVVFVDDSPMELAEVESVHPGITGLRFSGEDPEGVWQLFVRLRTLFGKASISAEDSLRLVSLRATSGWPVSVGGRGGGADEFLAHAEAIVEFECPPELSDSRPLELINKTNQFNLNGRRLTHSEWRERLTRPDAVVLCVSYSDKFGPLGKIAVLAGTRRNSSLRLETWVMSCRAFSRRIEYQCLRYLFEECGIERIELDSAATAKNGPMQEFLQDVQEQPGTITKSSFAAGHPALFHSVHTVFHEGS